MKYVSTRGEAPVLGFDDVLLAGLAVDGGLYVPETWPELSSADVAGFAGRSYAEVGTRLMAPFLGGGIDEELMGGVLAEAYARFRHPAVVPLRQVGDNEWVLELFHGPTLAFKDVALQVLGRLFDAELTRRGERLTILGATSGDTGPAAIEACRDRNALDVFILHPAGRISEVQRRQMTSVSAGNVHNLAVEGTFDDCQDLVKAIFGDLALRERLRLSAVNSINWARVLPQAVYYLTAAVSLGGPSRPVTFSVPTGNFGNALAGWVARRMGAPISRLVVASNRNDIATRFLTTGVMELQAVHPTTSPAMDIQVSSNLERLLFELLDRHADQVARLMVDFGTTGRMEVPLERLAPLGDVFDTTKVDDDTVATAMGELYAASGHLVDPHTAVGLVAGRACRRDPTVPLVAMATAHPAKFPDTVEAATGVRPELPDHLADLFDRPERCTTLPCDIRIVRDYVVANARAGGAGGS
ncbi:MAG: threonine synthase [Actinobacteria bacterium]|nr:threonine synthase [Actinomycetota bacterium]MBW3641522.1 threonine synthase [Actinomycetota bacterium]